MIGIAGIVLVIAFLWPKQSTEPTKLQPTAPPATADNTTPSQLARLGTAPEWERLQVYQGSMTRAEFVAALEQTYSLREAWRTVIRIDEEKALIHRSEGTEPFILEFAAHSTDQTPPRKWRSPSQIPANPDPKRPLLGMRIAIDPGHIGGHFAKMEGREFRIDQGPPVREGEMTLKVAMLLKARLEALGASTYLTRMTNEPITKFRPKDFSQQAKDDLDGSNSTEFEQQRRAALFFYRVSEIRERAKRLHHDFQPDLTLCLHFNAEAWGDPKSPTLTTRNHFHLLVNGAYGAGELAQDDQRFEMLQRLLQRCDEVESVLAAEVATHFAEKSGLEAYRYTAMAMAKPGPTPFVWKRNLLANRIFPSPVLYFEPYVMNTQVVYDRVMAGDYEGTKKVAGKMRPSIFREYADGVADGLVLAVEKYRSKPGD